MGWNNTYNNLVNYIEANDKEFAVLFNTPNDIKLHLFGNIEYILELIKKLYKYNLGISIDEFNAFRRNIEFDYKPYGDYTSVTVKCIDYTLANILEKELELKIAYSRVKTKYHKSKMNKED